MNPLPWVQKCLSLPNWRCLSVRSLFFLKNQNKPIFWRDQAKIYKPINFFYQKSFLEKKFFQTPKFQKKKYFPNYQSYPKTNVVLIREVGAESFESAIHSVIGHHQSKKFRKKEFFCWRLPSYLSHYPMLWATTLYGNASAHDLSSA